MDASLLETMSPSARQKLLGQAAQQTGKVVEDQVCNLRPGDFGHYLFHSGDIAAIIPALSHESPIVRKWAIKGFIKVWFQQSTAQTIIDAVGGSTGLADILNYLPFDDAKSLVSKLGNSYRGPADIRTHTLDELAVLLVPMIGKEGPVHPISRLGSTLATMLLPSCSPKIVKSLLKLASKRDRHRLHRLLHTQPVLVAELLKTPYEEIENQFVTFEDEDLKRLFAMSSVRSVPAHPGTHWGLEQFLQLVRTPRQPKLVYQGDIANRITLGTAVLRNTSNGAQWCQVVEALLEISKEERGKISFDAWSPIIRSIADKLSTKTSQSAQGSFTSERLCKYLKEINALILNGVSTGLPRLLPTVPQSTRNTLLRTLHSLEDGHDWKFPDDATKVSLSTVSLLRREEGEPLLKAMEPHFNTSAFHWSNNQYYSAPISHLNGLISSQAADRDNAFSIALRGRWAFMEADREGVKELKDEIENWKQLVHRQRQPEGRIMYAQTLITMAAITGDLNLLKEVWSWILDRFLKDGDVRNGVFQTYIHYCSRHLAGNKKDLQKSAQTGDDIISSYIEALIKARTEPDFDREHFYGIFQLIRKVLVSRIWLCERLRVGMEVTESLVAPLKKLWLQAENASLEDFGTFGTPKKYPVQAEPGGFYWGGLDDPLEEGDHSWSSSSPSYIHLSFQYRRVLLRFMDRIGRARDELYASVRDDLNQSSEELSPYDQRYPWPFTVYKSFFEGIPIEEDTPFILEYLRKIIFLPLDGDHSMEEDVVTGQWQGALNLYSGIARVTRDKRDDMLGQVIEYYRTKPIRSDGVQFDLAPQLFDIKEFMDAVHSSERLTQLMFMPYDIANADYSRLNLTLDIERSFFEDDDKVDANFRLLKRRQDQSYRPNTVQNIVPEHTLRGSHQLRRHLTILATTLWINSLPGIEKGDKEYQMLHDDLKQLDFKALYSNSGLPDMSSTRKNRQECKFVAANVDIFSKEEILNLIETLKALVPAKEGQPHRSRALRALALTIVPRSNVPTLMEEDIFEVLRDPEQSSIHRHFFTQRLLGVVPPNESKRLTRRFVDQTLEAMKYGAVADDGLDTSDREEAMEGSEAMEDSKAEDSAEKMKLTEADEAKKPIIKISTIKCVAFTLAGPTTGYNVQEMSTQLKELTVGSVHPSLQEALLSQLVYILSREAYIQPGEVLDSIWETLNSFALMASSLDEWRLLTDEEWRRFSLPKITGMDSTRAQSIFNATVTNLPKKDRQRWALMVDEMLGAQARDTHRWICKFLRRHKVVGELGVVENEKIGPLLTCFLGAVASSYLSLRKYLQPNSWHLQVLRRQITGYIVADRLHLTTLRLDASEPKWRRSDDGKDFISLVAKWTSSPTIAFSTLVPVLKEFGDDDVRQALRDAIADHLQLSNTMITPGNASWRSVPWTTLNQLLAYLKPNVQEQAHLIEGWKTNIRPLLEWLLERAEAARSQAGKDAILYNAIIIRIKAYLLPFPKLYPDVEDVHTKYTNQLFALAVEGYASPLLTQSQLFDLIIPDIHQGDLVPNTFRIMKQLAEDADGRTDPTERLIGYRLVQIVANYIHSATSRSDRDEVANHLLSMENHEDPNVRLLALNVARARRFNVPSPEPTGVMATPLEAGWTAGADWDTNWAAESRIDWSASPGLPIVVTSPAFGRPRARGRAFSRARGRGRGRGRG